MLKMTEMATLTKSAYYPNYQTYRSQILMKKVENLNENCVKISRSYLLYYPRNKPSKSIIAGPDWFIVLNDSASLKMVIKMYFNFLRFFLKVLKLSECRRGDLYMTTNGNLVRFTHS